MKKLLTLSFAFSFALLLTGCIDQKVEPVAEPEEIVVEPVAEKTMDIKVYFSSEKDNEGMIDCQKTASVTRTIPKTTAVATAAIEQLFAGPTEEEMLDGLVKFNSQDADMSDFIKRVFVKGDTAYIDWVDFRTYEKPFFYNSSAGSCNVIPPLEDTLLQFSGIEKVIYAFDGDPAAYYEWSQIGCEPNSYCDPTPFQ